MTSDERPSFAPTSPALRPGPPTPGPQPRDRKIRPLLAVALAIIAVAGGAVLWMLADDRPEIRDTEVLAANGPLDGGPVVLDASPIEVPDAARPTPDAAVAAPPADRAFTVTSDPEGATVTLGDVDMGQTPLVMRLGPDESQVYEIAHRGYESARFTLPADADADGRMAIELERVRPRKKGTLVVSVSTWAEVFVDNKSHGYAPLRVPLPAGSHRLRLVNTSIDRNETVKIDIQPGKTTTIKRQW